MNPTLSKESRHSDESEQERIIAHFWIVTLLTTAVILAVAIGFLLLQS
jgi:hypothetical protein